MIIFATRGQRMKVVIDGNFIAKKWKIENFHQTRCYISQKKAENMYNMDSARKNENFCKKMIFFVNIFNFLEMLDDPQKFRIQIFQKKFQKWLFGTSQIVRETKSPILVSLALLL